MSQEDRYPGTKTKKVMGEKADVANARRRLQVAEEACSTLGAHAGQPFFGEVRYISRDIVVPLFDQCVNEELSKKEHPEITLASKQEQFTMQWTRLKCNTFVGFINIFSAEIHIVIC